MKKRLQAFCLMLLTFMAVQAQEEAIAVLSHEGSTKTFSGREALKQAYAEAAHGDLITLSSGQFEAVNIEKAITVRGAGLGVDKTYGTQPTVIYNNFYIGISDNTDHHFQLEGIFHDGTIYYRYNQLNVQFVKCRLNTLTRSEYEETGGTKVYGTCRGMSITQCKITGGLTCGANSTISVWNSYVYNPYTVNDETSNFSFMNCVVKTYSSRIYGSYLTNSIIYKYNTFYYNDRTTFTNCLIYGFSPATDKNTYTTFSKLDGVFKTYTGSYSELETFELRDDAKELYLGTDGTEVGMYGGVVPYTPRLAGPHISVFSVSPRASSDGKLSVRLQVDTTLE